MEEKRLKHLHFTVVASGDVFIPDIELDKVWMESVNRRFEVELAVTRSPRKIGSCLYIVVDGLEYLQNHLVDEMVGALLGLIFKSLKQEWNTIVLQLKPIAAHEEIWAKRDNQKEAAKIMAIALRQMYEEMQAREKDPGGDH